MNFPLNKKTLTALLIFLLAFSINSFSQARTVTTGGTWTSTAIWSGGTAASIGDVIGESVTFTGDLGGTGNVTYPSPLNFTIGNLSMGNGNDLTINAGATLNIGNSSTVRNLTTGNDCRIFVSGTLIIWGDLDPGNNFRITINAGGSLIVKDDFEPGNDSQFTSAGSVDIDGDFITTNNTRITVSGPMDVGGNLNFGNDAIVTLNSPGDLNVTGNIDGGNNGDVIIANGAGISAGGFFDLGNDADITVSGDFDVTGNFTLGSTPDVIVGSPNGDLNIGGNMSAGNDGDFQVDGSLDIGGSFTGGTNSDFDVDGLITIVQNVTVQNDSNITGTGHILVGGTCSDGSSTFCGVGQMGTFLPIKLLYINAVLINNQNEVELTWATEKEEGFDHFELERANSNLKFSKITDVSGAGYNTESLQEYTWVDSNPYAGENYYRLKAVDLDGSFEYFKIVSVSAAENKSFSVFPNPTNENFVNYALNFEYSSNDKIVVMDNMGNVIQRTSVSSLEGKLVFGETINPGLYFVQYVSDSFKHTVRVTIR